MVEKAKKVIIKYNMINNLRIRKMRKRIKTEQITIFSSNCLGGLLYHELGMKFLSPTVNTRFSSKDFVKFIINIDYYLNGELVEIESDEAYPVARLDDIVIHFVHYKSFQEAEAIWRQRCRRINWDSVYFILNDCDGIEEKDLIDLDNCRFKNIVVFTAKEHLKRRCAFYLPRFKHKQHVGNLMKKNILTGEMTIEQDFDFVGWFNQEKGPDLENYRISGC